MSSVVLVINSQNQLPHSHIAVCANSRPRYQVFHVSNYPYAGSRNLRPRVPPAFAEAARATNHAAATRSSGVRRVGKIPAAAMALVGLGRYSWLSRRDSLPITQHHRLSQLSSPLPMWHASIDSNIRGEDPHPCGRLLLHACLAAAAVAVASYWS